VATCPTCGHENPADARFCNACAAPLIAAIEERREERKVVTVLFADLVGFTSQTERLDPEDVRALLAPYWEHLRQELERFGGTVEKFIGDAVMALFGAPVAHEDDPERAVRAALTIRDWVRDSGEELRARIAVNTGEALVVLAARPSEGEGMAAGDVVNTAARLQTAAPVNGVLVGETTYRATRDLIEYAEREPVVAKGKSDPLRVWEALAPRSLAKVEIVPTGPLVGRRRELEQLVGALERTRSEREPQLVTVSGVPGMGKSRLVGELFAIVDADEQIIAWRQGRSLSYGEGVSFWALGEIVKAEIGVLGSDSRDVGEEKLATVLADLLPDADRDWVAAHLRPLLGLATDEPRGSENRGESFAAWRRFLEALAERRPTVLVFEDLHWADDALLDFVDELPEWVAGVPLLIVCTTRPELFERRPGWSGGKRNALAISLGPLSDEETARIVAGALETPLMDAATQAAVLGRAGGNPLYAEQYARMVAEGIGADAELPETVQGIIAARVDLLAPDEKALLQDASVIGRVFWPGAIDSSEDRLHSLVRKEFIRRERRSSIGGETEYAFAHVLVRDVAYTQIPRAARCDKHRHAAAWIETLPVDRAGDRADLLAHHYTSAIELGKAAGLDTSALLEPARLALREAGDRAVELVAYEAADRHYSAALELWPAHDATRGRLLLARGRVRSQIGGGALEDLEPAVPLLLAVGDVEGAVGAEIAAAGFHWFSGHRDAADACADRALALVADAPPSRAKAEALAQRARLLMLGQQREAAVEVATQALELSEALGIDALQASALIARGAARGDENDDLRRGIEIAERSKSFEQLFRGLNNLGEQLISTGKLDEVSAIYARVLNESEQLGFAPQLLWTRAQDCFLRYLKGEWDRALELAATLLGSEANYMESQLQLLRALIRYARDDVTGALADAQAGVDGSRRAKDKQAVGPAVATHALLLAREGRAAEAGALFDELLTVCREHDQLPYFTWAPPLAWTAVELGRTEELRPVMRYHVRSVWVDGGAAACEGDFAAAASILADVSAPDAAEAALYAARAFLASGDRAAADEQLAAARSFYRSVGATQRIRVADTLLAATA
jgi:class 3 adenylate cyclase/tetratricopeptide (TPR) repeat protein